ncbi:hypothetical protein MUK42_33577 [Musa troglodytarum]|uniref:Uncharacterized protein n=1 Tax=Musa troglodytarum TaxID=320322 RepID=A0A9E7I5Q9_9LILI|nr:hypothetical protein MUK42_33577 [Musa troglodytarum]
MAIKSAGFSTDVPPNLQTFLTDRLASRVQGLSPASVNGRGFGPKIGRQSISPSSRSVRLPHNSEGDCFSSISKPPAASSFEDDIESHASVGVSATAATGKCRDFANTNAMRFSKKISQVTSASSAPKRSIYSALRKMVICPQFLFSAVQIIFIMYVLQLLSCPSALFACIILMYLLSVWRIPVALGMYHSSKLYCVRLLLLKTFASFMVILLLMKYKYPVEDLLYSYLSVEKISLFFCKPVWHSYNRTLVVVCIGKGTRIDALSSRS